MPDINSLPSPNRGPDADSPKILDAFKSELPDSHDIKLEELQFCERLAKAKKKQIPSELPQGNEGENEEADIEEKCQGQIDYLYSLLPKYRQLAKVLRHELENKMIDAEQSELHKSIHLKLHRIEKSYVDAIKLVKRMDLTLNGIQEVDALGNPVDDVKELEI